MGKIIFIRDNFGAELRLGNAMAPLTWMAYLHPTQDVLCRCAIPDHGRTAIAMRNGSSRLFEETTPRFAGLCLKRSLCLGRAAEIPHPPWRRKPINSLFLLRQYDVSWVDARTAAAPAGSVAAVLARALVPLCIMSSFPTALAPPPTPPPPPETPPPKKRKKEQLPPRKERNTTPTPPPQEKKKKKKKTPPGPSDRARIAILAVFLITEGGKNTGRPQIAQASEG